MSQPTTIQGIPDLGPGLRLHLNENTGGCSPKVVEAVRAFDAQRLALYPDFRDAVLETAAFLGTDPDRVLLTNGLDEGILLASIAYLTARTPAPLVALGAPFTAPSGQPEIVVALPTFEPYVSCAHGLGARVVEVPPGADFAFPVDGIVAAITPNTRIVYINNPNNPSGAVVAKADIRRVIAAAGHAVVFVDEAYHDFMGENFLAEAARHPNVIIGRTFSKAHGLAGLRVGVLVASPELLAPIRPVTPLFNLNVGVGGGTAGGAHRHRVPAVVRGAGHRLQAAHLRRLRAARAALLAERRQLRTDRRRRPRPDAHRRDDRPRHLRARPDEDAVLRQLLPPDRRRAGAHRSRRWPPWRTCAPRADRTEHHRDADPAEAGDRRAGKVRRTGPASASSTTCSTWWRGTAASTWRSTATGDLDVDQHHTVEDVGIALGEAVREALGDKKGINRAGYFVMPMDETLAVAAIDLSGRPATIVDTKVKVRLVGDLQAELVHDFFEGFARAHGPTCT